MEEYNEKYEIYDSEEEECIEMEEKRQLLKQFTFNDFWEYNPTKKIIQNDFIQQFIDTAGQEIIGLYIEETKYCKQQLASLFSFDYNGTNREILSAIVFNNIKKDYNLDVFDDDPNIANSFIYYQQHREKKKYNIKRNLPINATKKFDWGTKTYK